MNSQEKERALKLLLSEYLESYFANRGRLQIKLWLAGELQKHMPSLSSSEINTIAEQIISSLDIQTQKAESLNEAFTNGMSKEHWFAREIKSATSTLPEREQSEFVRELGASVMQTKSELAEIITPSSSESDSKIPSRLEDIAREIGNNALMSNIITDEVFLQSAHTESSSNSQLQIAIKEELESGNDSGIKAAVAGAGYAAAERGLIELHKDKECRPILCASMAQTVIEKARISGGFVKYAVKEGINALERSAVANIVAALFAAKGTGLFTSLTYAVCKFFMGNVAGAGVAAVVGVMAPQILYSAGEELGRKAAEYIQKERPAIVQRSVELVKKGAQLVTNTVKSVLKVFS